MNDKHQGSCFCGAVEFTVSGAPVAMGYCHCESCRQWSASPVNGFTLWNPDSVMITKGAADLGTFNKTDRSARKWCKVCGGHVLTEHPGMGLTDVYAGVLPDFPFAPVVHVHYGETVMPVDDGLPKQKDLPSEMGGSGIVIDDAPMKPAELEAFVDEWITNWNTRNVEGVLSHFAEGVTFYSPKAAALVGKTTIRGKAALRAYWSVAAQRIERLEFTLINFAWDARQSELFISYICELNADRVRACERLRFAGHYVIEGEGLYGAAL